MIVLTEDEYINISVRTLFSDGSDQTMIRSVADFLDGLDDHFGWNHPSLREVQADLRNIADRMDQAEAHDNEVYG